VEMSQQNVKLKHRSTCYNNSACTIHEGES